MGPCRQGRPRTAPFSRQGAGAKGRPGHRPWARRGRSRATGGSIAKNPWRHDPEISWYGGGFFGSGTACGQTYTRTIVGVAHRSLPCGTRITFRYNGRDFRLTDVAGKVIHEIIA